MVLLNPYMLEVKHGMISHWMLPFVHTFAFQRNYFSAQFSFSGNSPVERTGLVPATRDCCLSQIHLQPVQQVLTAERVVNRSAPLSSTAVGQ